MESLIDKSLLTILVFIISILIVLYLLKSNRKKEENVRKRS
jgi:cbb3-type cytochrome oxidase subunit 3